MKNRIIALILLVCAVQLSFAQVKRQYQDETFNQTTVVVKDNQANDLDVLNQFDPDEFGMDQVIRITTETGKKPVLTPEKTPSPSIQKSTPAEIIPEVVPEVAPEDRKPVARRWAKRAKKVEKPKKTAEKPSLAKAKKPADKKEVNRGGQNKVERGNASRKVNRSKSSSSSKVKKKKKRKNRRFKRAKRKKNKKRYSCYSF